MYHSLAAVLVVELEVLLEKVLREPAAVSPTFRRCGVDMAYVVMAYVAVACHGLARISPVYDTADRFEA